MNISAIFIRRPVMTTLVMAAIMIFGLIAYRQLPVSDLPPVDYPTISVSASLSGASAETMASSVATPLEKQFSTIAGLETMTSTSAQGNTSITLQFALSKDIDAAAQDVQSAISRVLRQLPQDIIPPSYNKVDPSASSILYYALRTTTLPLSELDEYAQTCWPNGCPWWRALRRYRCTAPRSTPSGFSSIPRPSRCETSGSMRWLARWMPET